MKNEFVLEDGRKGEEVKIVKEDTVVQEIYVEPKPVVQEVEKKLVKRVTERRPCGYEKEIELYDEVTGEITRVVEKQDFATKQEVEQMIKDYCGIKKSCCNSGEPKFVVPQDAKKLLEEKINSKKSYVNYVFVGLILIQIVALVWLVLK
jgi:hypothetical protein